MSEVEQLMFKRHLSIFFCKLVFLLLITFMFSCLVIFLLTFKGSSYFHFLNVNTDLYWSFAFVYSVVRFC